MHKNKLKILMVGLLPLEPEEVKGGVVAVIRNLFSGFSKRDDVEIVHVSFNEEIDEPVVKQYASNIRVHHLPYKVKVKLIDYFVNKKSFRRILSQEKPDLIHIQEVSPQLFRFIFFPKDKIVVTQHGIAGQEFRTAIGMRNKLKSLFKGYVERYIFPLFDNIIFLSQYNKRLFPKKKKVFSTNIYNPVNPLFLETLASTGVPNSLIYVGVISKNKNLKIILDAMGILKSQQVVFMLHVVGGYKDPAYGKEIQSAVLKNNLSDQVIFHGWQTQQQILELYNECGIFILPSQQETMPVSIGEAMAQGKVVIASNVGAISEMFTDKKAGFVFESNNVNQLCEVLKLLYDNTSLIDSVSQQARKEAQEKFHPDWIVRDTVDFYYKVINKVSS